MKHYLKAGYEIRVRGIEQIQQQKVNLDGYVFDSQAEANYYEGLKIRSARGKFKGLNGSQYLIYNLHLKTGQELSSHYIHSGLSGVLAKW